MYKPLVSIIMPTYKRNKMLKESIKSILAQTYSNWELIIVDDNNSSSSFRKKNEKYFSNLHIKKIKYIKHNKNMGASKARNTGLEIAKGRYVAFLDDDDIWMEKKLEIQVENFYRLKNIDIVYTNYYIVNKKTDSTVCFNNCDDKEIFPQLLFQNCVGTLSTPMIRKKSLLEINGFDNSLPSCQDWDVWIRLFKNNCNFKYIKKPLVKYYNHNSDRISKDANTKIKGHQMFFNKHIDLINGQNKVIRSKYYHNWGRILYYFDKTKWSKQKLFKSFLLFPFNINNIILLLMSLININIYKNNFFKKIHRFFKWGE